MLFHGFPSVSGGAKKIACYGRHPYICSSSMRAVSLVSDWRLDDVGLCVRDSGGMLSDRFKTLVGEESYLGYRSESAKDPED